MEFKNLRVLVLDGSGKQPLAMIRGLKEIGCHVTVLCASKWDTGYVSKLPDKRILEAGIASQNENYIGFVLNQARSDDYDVIMPIGEMSTNVITQHEDEFKPYVKIACAPTLLRRLGLTTIDISN